ncbi:MAG: polyprenyl synthetase family protein, partial [Pseudomonadota bacterium]|nr:polyprenyl synthetase family protein [Pseudomonadota bacterium]
KERAFWRRTVERLEQNDDDLATAQRLIRKHGALDDTVARARHYTAVGRDALDIFDDGPVKAALIEVLEFCVERAH